MDIGSLSRLVRPHATEIIPNLRGFICSLLLCADEVTQAGKAAMDLQQITCNFVSLLSKQTMRSQTAFFRRNGSGMFCDLASAAGFEITSPR